ncbi:MAG: hypothetical protein U9N03_01475 [Candidatus Caldatribacteriota bacterium]|nr:hypothetical protein [Candidatus Caldatribacteriota bacterium]
MKSDIARPCSIPHLLFNLICDKMNIFKNKKKEKGEMENYGNI